MYQPPNYPYPPQRRNFRLWFLITSAVFAGIILALCFIAGLPSFIAGFQSTYVAPGSIAPVATPDVTSGVGHSRAQLGSQLSDFIIQYGSPTKSTPTSDVFVTDGSVQITAIANDAAVTQISITGSSWWTAYDTQAFCVQFLPADARETSHTATEIDYSSAMGGIVLQVQAPNCTLIVS